MTMILNTGRSSFAVVPLVKYEHDSKDLKDTFSKTEMAGKLANKALATSLLGHHQQKYNKFVVKISMIFSKMKVSRWTMYNCLQIHN